MKVTVNAIQITIGILTLAAIFLSSITDNLLNLGIDQNIIDIATKLITFCVGALGLFVARTSTPTTEV